MTNTFKHIYDWLDEPSVNDAERDAKEWLDKFTAAPSMDNMRREEFLAQFKLTVEWKGARYECTGASRMGDVWLRNDNSINFYDHRVNVEELSNWKRIRTHKQ